MSGDRRDGVSRALDGTEQDRVEMRTVAAYYNPAISDACALACDVADWVRFRGPEAVVIAGGAPAESGAQREHLAGADLMVTVGGDGSILRASHVAAPLGIPILGINLGRVGFLTETGPDGWREALGRVLAGDFWIEDRMMLRSEAFRGASSLGEAEALNDVVVGRGERARVVHLRAAVDGGPLATYVADGLIVATPTGSTAYALAAGGPILPPQLRNILLVPVAPHLSMARPVVLSEGVRVRIAVQSRREAVLTVDGEVQSTLECGDEVVVAASQHVARFARVRERTYFYKTLVSRLVPRHQP
jgi:NAD+ kinase